jgi:uncharacterized protein DUF4333
MTSPYGPPGGNDPQQQWGQQPYGGGPAPGTPSGGMPVPGGYPQQQPGQPQPPQQQQPYGGYGQQPPQPTQQYGQPSSPYGQQQSPYGQQPPSGEFQSPYQHPYQQQQQPKKGGGAWIWIVMVVVVLGVAAFLVLGLVTPGFLNTKVFDQSALQGNEGVKKVLVNDYKVENIESVSCPADQEVKSGNKFECKVKVGGDDPKELTVQITVTSDDGQYQVALPQESK